jgi:uncharacterized membrane protein
VPDQTREALTPREQRGANPDRVLAFSDGVFAIIITILVLELKVPDLGSGQSLRASLAEMRPTMVAFVISFLLVGMYWSLHRNMFSEVRHVDTRVVWLNLLFLLPTSMIPFAASVVGEYEYNATALHLYGTVLILATLTRTALYWYLVRHPGLLWEPTLRQSRRLGGLIAIGPAVVYLIAMAVADVIPTLSLIIYFVLPLLYLGVVAFLKSDPRTKVAAADLS